MEVVFLRLARMDVRSAYQWYELKEPGLGTRFVSELVEYSRKIARGIVEYRKYMPGVQRVQLIRFPFSIFFIREAPFKALVIAVLHNKQNIARVLNTRLYE